MKIYFLNKTKRSIYGLKNLFNDIANFNCAQLGKENKYELFENKKTKILNEIEKNKIKMENKKVSV